MRRKLVVGNWKMNGDRAMTVSLCKDIAHELTKSETNSSAEIDIAVCPPHILIPVAVEELSNTPTPSIAVGAQDVDANPDGAFSGQVSTNMIADSGCRYIIVGHSERRALYGDTDELVAQKTQAVLAAGLTAIVCFGETLEQRKAGVTEQIIAQQLDAVLQAIGAAAFSDVVIAYEPVWAIGSGLTATPDEAQQVHQFIRSRLAAQNKQVAAKCRILYGGSMKPQNAAQLIAEADIDGGLIGGAALNATDFVAICNAARNADH